VTALQILAIMTKTGRSLAELVEDMPMYPQTLINVRTAAKIDLAASASIRAAIEKAEQQLADRGRVLLRASGTEPVIRVMVEGENATEVTSLAEQLAESVRQAAAG
jgi:phosphoglucosamine mutase